MNIPVIEKIMKLPQQTEESLTDAFNRLILDIFTHDVPLFQSSLF